MLFKLVGLIALYAVSNFCFALPENPVAILGNAEVLTHQENLVVRQESTHLIVDWQNFDIQASELVHFVMPDVHSVAINRVTGAFTPSRIEGRLISNGEIILLNPAGVIFGPRAFVDVAALMASSAMPSDLLGKNLDWTLAENAGNIVNQGTIHIANGGSLLFLGTKSIQAGQILGHHLTVLLLSAKPGLTFLEAGLKEDHNALAALPVQMQQYGSNQVFIVEPMATLPPVINMQGIAAQRAKEIGAHISLF